MAKKTFDEVKVGDKVRYYDPPLKGDKELETKDYKGGTYDAVVTALNVGQPGIEAKLITEKETIDINIDYEYEGSVDLVYFDPDWLPETAPRMFQPVFEHEAREVEGRGVIMVPILKENVEVELPMPKPGRNIQATGVPFRGRVGSKKRSWDFE